MVGRQVQGPLNLIAGDGDAGLGRVIGGPFLLIAMNNHDEKRGHDLLEDAEANGLYDPKTGDISTAAFAGEEMHWAGWGVENVEDLQGATSSGELKFEMPGVLYMSDPWLYSEEPRLFSEDLDDMESTCLCQNGSSCKTCRLQARVKNAEQGRYDALTELDIKLVEYDSLTEDHNQLKELYSQLESELEESETRANIAEVKVKQLLKEIQLLKHSTNNVSNKVRPQHSSPTTAVNQTARATSLINLSVLNPSHHHNTDQTYHHHGRGGKTKPGSDGKMGITRKPTENKPQIDSEDDEDDDIQPASRRLGRCGKTRSKSDAKESDSEKPAVNKPQNIRSDDGDDDDDKDFEPAPKRLGRSGKIGQKAGGKARDSGKVSEKKRQHDSDDSDDSDENLKPVPKRYQLAKPATGSLGRKAERKTGGKTCGSEKLVKKHRHDTDEDDDDFERGDKRHRAFNPAASSVGLGSLHPNTGNTVAKIGKRSTNNSQSSWLDAFASGSVSYARDIDNATSAVKSRSTNNPLGPFMDDYPSAPIPNLPQLTISTGPLTGLDTALPAAGHGSGASTAGFNSAATAAGLNPTATASAVTLARHTSTAGTVSKPKAWSNQEIQALIVLVKAHRDQRPGPNGRQPQILHDAKLFELMSRQLAAQYGIHRSAGACKNEWNRRGRALSGIDNRKVANPAKLATSLQERRN